MYSNTCAVASTRVVILPQIRIYTDLVQRIATDRNVMQDEGSVLAGDWQKWASRNRAYNTALVDVMHEEALTPT